MNAQPETTTTYPDFDAALTDAEVGTIEKKAHDFGINRRVLLAFLRLNRQQCMVGRNNDIAPEQAAETLLEIAESAGEYKGHLQGMLEMATAAEARALAAAQTMIDLRMVQP